MSVRGYKVKRWLKNQPPIIHQDDVPCLSHACQIAAEIGTLEERATVENERGATLFDSSKDEAEPKIECVLKGIEP